MTSVLERELSATGWTVLRAMFPQIRAIARELAERDESDELQAWFEGPATLSAEERERIEFEEGWILWHAEGPVRPQSLIIV